MGQHFCGTALEGPRVKVNQLCGSNTKKPNNVVGCMNRREVSAVSHTVSLVSMSRIPGGIVSPVWALHFEGSYELVREYSGRAVKMARNWENGTYLERLTN